MLSQIVKFLKTLLLIAFVLVVVFAGGWYGRDAIGFFNKELSPETQAQETAQPVLPPTPVLPQETASVEQPAPPPETPAAEVPAPVTETPVAPAAVEPPPIAQATPAPTTRQPMAFVPGETKVGNLSFKAKSAGVAIASQIYNDGSAKVSGSLSFLIQNTGDRPLSILIADPTIQFHYNNTAVISSRSYGKQVTGLSFCESEVERCKNTKPSPFTQIEPDSSPVAVTMSVTDSLNAANVKNLPLIKTGTFSTRLLVLDGTEAKFINVSLTDFPVTNNISLD